MNETPIIESKILFELNDILLGREFYSVNVDSASINLLYDFLHLNEVSNTETLVAGQHFEFADLS